MKYIIFSYDGIGFPIAKKLIDEGQTVTVVQVRNKSELGGDGDEDKEDRRRRLSLYDGVFPKIDLPEALNTMRFIDDKDDYFVWFDFNHLWNVSERVEALGFTKGLFVQEDDLSCEDDRNKSKEIVEKYYPGVKVGEVHEFKAAKDGIDFLNETQDMWALKGNDESAKTKVPGGSDAEKGKKVLIDLLTSNAKDYEKGGYILEKKIIDAYEITPEIVFYDGKPVFASADIENKPKAAGNEGIQLGCAQNLIIKLKLDDPISRLAFPPYVYDMAKDRKGIFIWDCGLLFKDGEFYFTEFCSQREGYDCVFTKIAMAGSASNYFESIVKGKNPLVSSFGAGARGLNENINKEDMKPLENIPMLFDYPSDTWVFEMAKDDEGMYRSTGSDKDLVVFTGAGDTLEEAVDACYEAREGFTFDDMAVRPKFDFLSREYLSSMVNRFMKLNHDYFELPDPEENFIEKGFHDKYVQYVKDEATKEKNLMKQDFDTRMKSFRDELETILEEPDEEE